MAEVTNILEEHAASILYPEKKRVSNHLSGGRPKLRKSVALTSHGQNGTGAGFLRVLQCPLSIVIPPITHFSIIQGWYNGSTSSRSTKWTQSLATAKKKKKRNTYQII
jgi:hypothetical protein